MYDVRRYYHNASSLHKNGKCINIRNLKAIRKTDSELSSV